MSEIEFWKIICDALGIEYPPDDVLENIFPQEFGHTVKLNVKVSELAGELSQKYKLGIISNTNEGQAKVFRKFDVLQNFDSIVLSHEVGIKKPDPGIYKIALQELELKPGESVFIDDMEENIRGAEALGIKGILFKNPRQLKEELKNSGVRL